MNEGMAITRRIIAWLSAGMDVLFGNDDGLDTTEYVERLERHFGIIIRDEDAAEMKTLSDVCDYISRQREASARALTPEQIWKDVRRITSEEFGVDESEMHKGVRFIEDLNC